MPRHKTSKNTESKSKEHSGKRWVSTVKTVSTFPPEGTFTKKPREIADVLADKKVSPKGIGSGIRMLQYFINRGGKGLSATRRKKLELAKEILHDRLEKQKRGPAASKTDRD